MAVVQVHVVGPQPLEALLDGRPHVLGLVAELALAVFLEAYAELGREEDLRRNDAAVS